MVKKPTDSAKQLEDAKDIVSDPVDNTSSWSFEKENSENNNPSTKQIDTGAELTWSASEFIDHKKSITWYFVLTVSILVIAAAVYLLTKDILSTIVVLFVGVIIGFYAARKPRILEYKLSDSGITIAGKYFDFMTFKSFAIIEEVTFPSIVLMPLKRFMPILSVYFDPKDEAQIIDMISSKLPKDTYKPDPIESFMQRVRF